MFTPNSYVEILTLKVMLCGDGTLVIRFKTKSGGWGSHDEISGLMRRGRELSSLSPGTQGKDK